MPHGKHFSKTGSGHAIGLWSNGSGVRPAAGGCQATAASILKIHNP
jgi:hypothetical protein